MDKHPVTRRDVLRAGVAGTTALAAGRLRGLRAAEAQAKGSIKVSYVMSVADNDKSCGQSQREVLNTLEKEFKPLGMDLIVLQSYGVSPPDYGEVAAKHFALGAKVLIILEEGRGPELFKLGQKYPTKYIVESGIGLEDTTPPGTKALPKNMMVVDTGFAHVEQHYLCGILAGLMTKVNKVGFIGGEPFPSVVRKGYGFIAGVKDVNPAADVSQYIWAGKWGDPDLGRKLAAQEAAYGVDIMLQFANGTGLGVMLECNIRKLPVFGACWAGLIKEFPEVCIGVTNVGGYGYPGTQEIFKKIIMKVADGTFEREFGGKVIFAPLSGGPASSFPPPLLNPAWLPKIPKVAMDAYNKVLKSHLDGSLDIQKFKAKLEAAKKLVKGR